MNAFTTVPALIMEIDGQELATEIMQTVASLRIKQILSLPSQCEIKFPEATQQWSSEFPDKVGSRLSIFVEGNHKPLFSGQITAVDFVYQASQLPLIIIRAYDLLHQLRKRQPVRTHQQVNLFQLAKDLTQDLNVNVKGGDSTPTTTQLFQYGQSDLQFLQEFCEQNGQYFFLDDTQLRLFSLTEHCKPISLQRGKNLLEFRFSVNAETVTDSVTATGWNLQNSTAQQSTVHVSDSDITDNRNLDPSRFSSPGLRTLIDQTIKDQKQAEVTARKELEKNLIKQQTFWGVAEGNPSLTPGSCIELVTVAPPFQGEYVLTEVTHTIDPASGYLCELNTAPSAKPKKPARNNATLGVVSQVSDPENRARIKVTLPTFNNLETEWLQVVSPGAGLNKGQLMLPDIGDTVLLLIMNGELSQSIILGGVYGKQDLPEQVVADGVVQRYITRTAGQQSILLDDQEVSIKITTENGHQISLQPQKITLTHNNGSYIKLADNQMSIHSKTRLQIEAPGQSITFRGKKIDFEEA